MNPLVLFNEGQLDDAVKVAVGMVQSNPSDVGMRVILAELLCFAGELERADKQLETAERIDASSALPLIQFRQIIRSEVARLDFYESGRMPSFLTDPSRELKIRLEAGLLLREKKTGEARSKLAQAEELRSVVNGVVDTQRFDDLRDGDDLIASVLEVLSSDGRYFWIPFAAIESVTFDPPKRPRDLLFRPAMLSVRGGPEGMVFVPALYAGSAKSDRSDIRLARATDWVGGDHEPVRGLGQRVLMAGGEDKPILNVESIVLDPPDDDRALPKDGDS